MRLPLRSFVAWLDRERSDQVSVFSPARLPLLRHYLPRRLRTHRAPGKSELCRERIRHRRSLKFCVFERCHERWALCPRIFGVAALDMNVRCSSMQKHTGKALARWSRGTAWETSSLDASL